MVHCSYIKWLSTIDELNWCPRDSWYQFYFRNPSINTLLLRFQLLSQFPDFRFSPYLCPELSITPFKKIPYLVFSLQENNNLSVAKLSEFCWPWLRLHNAYYLNQARHFVFFTAEFTNKLIELNLQKYNPLPYLKRYKYAMIVNTVVTPSCTDGGTTRFRQKNCVIWWGLRYIENSFWESHVNRFVGLSLKRSNSQNYTQ